MELNLNEDKNISADTYYKETIRDPGKEGRKASNILFLRSFNNYIKKCLISKTKELIKRKDIKVLDLCCGKGGDIEKFNQIGAVLYVGVDMSKESLIIAKDRINKNRLEKGIKINNKFILIEEDLSNKNHSIWNHLKNEQITFNLVSCQMALHYQFGCEDHITNFLNIVNERLEQGGYFIATIIDDNVLVKRLRENKKNKGTLTFGNQFYSVKFFNDKINKNQTYGHKYGFYLEDSIDRRGKDGEINYVIEYLIILDKFVELCKNIGLNLIKKQNFLDYYQELTKESYYSELSKRFLNGFDVPNYEQQWEIAQLYQVVIFRKGKEMLEDKGFRYSEKSIDIKSLNPEKVDLHVLDLD